MILGVAGMIALGACATPIEVKQASKAQLELLTTLEHAAEDLQQSLGQFHRAQRSAERTAATAAECDPPLDRRATFPPWLRDVALPIVVTDRVHLSIAEARALSERAMRGIGYEP